jgi:hypothetical protein
MLATATEAALAKAVFDLELEGDYESVPVAARSAWLAHALTSALCP